MNPEQWLSLKWNGGSTMSDRWLNQSKIIHLKARSLGKARLTYKVTKYPKKAKKCMTVTKSGKVTLKKKAKKGTYKIRITAAKTSKYQKAVKYVTVKVK